MLEPVMHMVSALLERNLVRRGAAISSIELRDLASVSAVAL